MPRYLGVLEPVDNLSFLLKQKTSIFSSTHFNLTSHTFSYLSENLSCLFYGFDVLATRYAFFASYHDLLADIAEAFGIWVALMVLVISSLTVLVAIQQTTSFAWESSKVNNNKTTSTANLTSYKSFTKFNSKNTWNL